MKLATVKINLSKEGHEVVRENVTPAELALMVAEHHRNAGGKVLEVDDKGEFQNDCVKETGDTTQKKEMKDGKLVVTTVPARTTTEEKQRLCGRFAINKVNAMFPGGAPTMPATFKDAYKLGIATTLPTSKLTEVKII